MKKVLFLAVMLICLVGCKSSKNAQEIGRGSQDVWQTMLVKQIDCQIDDNIITVKYDNGTTLCYSILDNFGHVALTWDRSGGRKSFDEGVSTYKGAIDIPSFVTSGDHDEFLFQVIQIDENAFYGCSKVTSINLPYSIGIIRRNAFKDCTALKEITVDDNNQAYTAVAGVLYSKDHKMLVQYPVKKADATYELLQDANVICTEAFKGCEALTKVIIGNAVTAISDNAFTDCKNLQELRLGSSVRIIGANAFKGCPNIAYIYSPSFFAPHNSPSVFENSIKETCKVTVPRGQKMNYMRQLEWREFKNIQEEW